MRKTPAGERARRRRLRSCGDACPLPVEAAGEARVVGVVGGNAEVTPASFEEVVPVHGREAAAHLELAARVVDLESGDALAEREAARRRAGPVRVCEVGDAPVLPDPRCRGGEIGARAYELERILVDAEGEEVPVRLSG